jgi:hypothetical protein
LDVASLTKVGSGIGRWTLMPHLVLTTIAVTMPLAVAAQTQTWYLMAPDEKILSNPRVTIRMEHGPVLGPLEFSSRAKFSSRAECEPARLELIKQWRQLSVIQRGSWNKYGFTSPSVFARCVPADDPQLKGAHGGAEAAPSMETFLNRPSHR